MFSSPVSCETVCSGRAPITLIALIFHINMKRSNFNLTWTVILCLRTCFLCRVL